MPGAWCLVLSAWCLVPEATPHLLPMENLSFGVVLAEGLTLTYPFSGLYNGWHFVWAGTCRRIQLCRSFMEINNQVLL